MNATLSTMWSISALFAVQLTLSKRAGSRTTDGIHPLAIPENSLIGRDADV